MSDEKVRKIELDEIAAVHSMEAMLVSVVARHFLGELSDEDKKLGIAFFDKVINTAREMGLKSPLFALALLALISAFNHQWQKGVLGVGVTDSETGELTEFHSAIPEKSKLVN